MINNEWWERYLDRFQIAKMNEYCSRNNLDKTTLLMFILCAKQINTFVISNAKALSFLESFLPK
jgi:hypothetical protein